MTNSEIRNKLKLVAKLMELHGENPFKIRGYQSAADLIKTLAQDLKGLDEKEIVAFDGIGKGMASNIYQLLTTGSFESLTKMLDQTPEGVIEMFKISGFGAKKIGVLWQEGGAENLDQLLALCQNGEVAPLKGFAEKSQETLTRAVEFAISCRGFAKYAQVEPIMKDMLTTFESVADSKLYSETAELRRRMEVIDRMDFLVATDDIEKTRAKINGLEDLTELEQKSGPLSWFGHHKSSSVPIKIQFCDNESFINTLFKTTAHPKHLHASLKNGKSMASILKDKVYSSEQDIFADAGMDYVEPEMREGSFEIDLAQDKKLPQLIEMADLKGVLHNHSTYSDGKHTLRQMAEHCRDLGYEYLGISDHSQTAVYASGLKDFTVKEQQEEIEALNKELAPFKIFSGIESDILADGSLDYPDDILQSFDFIVASVHAGLAMDVTKATNRLLTAIKNPHTTILGHMTGRLILERQGYPVDHKAIIDACVEHQVVIEINASPYRLDMDWRWVQYAIEKGVMLSINPDAHHMDGYNDMYYGVLAARKGGLTKEMNLNSKSLSEIESYFSQKKTKA